MKDEFAILNYVDNRKKLATKFKLFNYDFFWNIYLKSLPLRFSDINILGSNGFIIETPIKIETITFDKLINKILKLKQNIKIIKLNYNYVLLNNNSVSHIKIANGISVFAFFIIDLLKKRSDILNKNFKDINFVILDNNNNKLTNFILDNIYDKINYLSLLTENPDLYIKKEQKIFEEVGLNLEILELNKINIKNADVIINTGVDLDFTYAIKHKAVYMDLAKNSNQIKTKRHDIFYIDNINLSYENKIIDLLDFENAIYCNNKIIQKAINLERYDKEFFLLIRDKIYNNKIKICEFQKCLN